MDTKGHCFPKSIIIQAVYLKLRFTLRYRDVEEIMRIRGVEVDHATTQRWVYKFMPEIEIQMCKRKKVKDNNGTPELINIDKSGSNKSAIKLYNKRSFTNIQQGLGFKDFESARRTITGIEIVHMIKKDQLNTQERSMFKSFYSLAA